MLHTRSIQVLREAGIARVAIACGVFDGLHRGHQQILDALHRQAAATGAAAVVVTFSPHPRALLQPDASRLLLLSDAHKRHILTRLGIDATVVLPFTPEFAAMEPDRFITEALLAGPTLTAVCVGEQWRFGRDGTGDTALLRRVGERHGFTVSAVPELAIAGELVSSTRIRTALEAGDLQSCRKLLGRPFSIYGPVEHGRGIATDRLHYPTANVVPDNEVYPPTGIYAAAAVRGDGPDEERFPGVCYLGYSPTFPGQAGPRPTVEMHLFDFHDDIYGANLEIEFLHFIRQDCRFPTPEALAVQIGHDVAEARAWHQRQK